LKRYIIIALFLCAVCVTFLTPISDNDFFWHLATGRWIAEHRELPQTDPFAYTTSLKAQEDFYRAKIILTQYWLANLLQYGIFSLAGFNGIIGLRVLVFVLTVLIVGVHMRRKGLGVMLVILLLLPLIYVLMNYKGDRPNQMTFLFLALFMYLADAVKQGEKKGYLLPLVFVVWANMHGGFLLGAAIAVIMVVSELLRKVFLRDHLLNRGLVVVMLITLGAGFLNPNGYMMMYSLLFESSAYYTATIAEARTPWSFTMLGDFGYVWMLGITGFFAGWYVVFRIFSRSSRLKEALLELCDELLMVMFLFGLSCTAIRYIPLFAIALVPVTAPLFSGRVKGVVQKLSRYFIPELLIAAFSLWWIYGAYANTVLKLPPVDPYYPDDAVQFIKKNEMKGRFYNFYDWGGYLIWQFYPEQSVFIDGRGLSMSIYRMSNAVINTRQKMSAEKSLYKSVLDSFSVRHLIIPGVKKSGDILYLLKALEHDPEWRLIFAGRNSLIYTLDPVRQEYPKTLSYVLALSSALEAMSRTPDSPYPYLTYAKANSYLGRQNAAIGGLEEALKNRPSLRGGPVEKALQLLKEGKEIPIDMN
jgi:hypothetical protein